ncbi:GNAT family N-acetyltransferase [Streptomyces sp. HPF1205]|uniref:GNAT family N-acetyltransferase n=1 Tax=Streptomyces sp. HPF1205 TaxID=2873262 RepID=UPI001CEDCBA2|nr:GNAT family N-acetyltransferase [Streptomyces sp. HPF1205]
MTTPRVMTVTHYTPAEFPGIRQQLLDVYAEVYAVEARTDPFFSLPRFAARLDGHARHPGWACAMGEIGDEVVGYAYGRPDSEDEWRTMTTVTAPEVRDYGVGGNMFGLCEIMVRAPWRGAGAARTIHDELMRDRPEPRASLLVEQSHPRVRATYERWGYQAVATSRPYPDAPAYDAMVLDLSAAPAD